MSIAATYYYHLAQSIRLRLAVALGITEADGGFLFARLTSAIAIISLQPQSVLVP
ncbi:MAG: hypothetical protein LDL41_25815 [Coleofasciculus sp. S288]|nr:hypothetical protein [Coleofasciculus sp. S288]